MSVYYRPIAQIDPCRPADALPIAGGWSWFNRVERIERGKASELLTLDEVPADVLNRISGPRAPVAGLELNQPKIMGILNVTPDSFSDGGKFLERTNGVPHALQMVSDGADILDIGGESTRPGAQEVEIEEEIARTAPVIEAIRKSSDMPVSIDTRKSVVATAAINAGATIVNDVSGFEFDPRLSEVVALSGLPVCLMHSQGDPETMQKDPRYDDVLLDVYDFLQGKVDEAVADGIPRDRIIVDPGIGFGKTLVHNIRLLRGISLFHALGCSILLGVSRKRFIGTLGNAPEADQRVSGSVAVAMAAVSQGVQILRVHDVAETRQALSLHMAVASA